MSDTTERPDRPRPTPDDRPKSTPIDRTAARCLRAATPARPPKTSAEHSTSRNGGSGSRSFVRGGQRQVRCSRLSGDAPRPAVLRGAGRRRSARPPPGFDRCEQLAAASPESEATARCFAETGVALQQADRATARLQELSAAASGKPLAHVLPRLPGFPPAERSPAWPPASPRGATPKARCSPGSTSIACCSARGGWTRPEPRWTGRFRSPRAPAIPSCSPGPGSSRPGISGVPARTWRGPISCSVRRSPRSFPTAPTPPRRSACSRLADLNLELGRYQEGLEAFRRLAELAAAKQDPYAEANARYGMARAVLDQTAELPSEEGRREAIRLAAAGARPRGRGPERNHPRPGAPDPWGPVARARRRAAISTPVWPPPLRRATRATASTVSPASSPGPIRARRRRRSTDPSSSPVKPRTPGPWPSPGASRCG